MPTSSYMPDVSVAVALNSGYLTPAASRTYTDISTYVELAYSLTINVGRQDERSVADANTCVFVVDNTDGRFTPSKTSGPYGSNFKLGRPVRVQADPVDGAIQTEFVGFIDEISLEWEGTDGYSYVTVTCTSRLARLGLQASLKSVVETEILADSPVAYYTLSESEGATQANDSSGNRALPLVATNESDVNCVVFGNGIGPGTDELTAVQLTKTAATQSAGSLRNGAGFSSVSSNVIWAECFFSTTQSVVQLIRLSAGDVSFVLSISSGQVASRYDNGVALSIVQTPSASYNDDATHHALAVATTVGTTVTLELYVDGVSIGTDSDVVAAGQDWSAMTVGPFSAGVTTSDGTLTIAHAAVGNTAISAARVAAHASAGFTGFAGETTSARLIRYADYAGVPSTEISTETGQTTVAHVDTTGKQAAELMRLMETTEGGFLHDARDGALTFHNRGHRTTASSIYTLDMAQQHVEQGYAPKFDRSGIANDISAANVAGTYSAHVFDLTSQTENGYAASSIETASEDDDEPLFLSSWALYKYKDPKVRVPTLSVQALAQVSKTPNCSAVMATNPGDKITVSNHPSQAASSSMTFFVEGYTKVYGPESLLITFNVSPSAPDDTVLVIGDATRGVIGTNPVAL